MPSFKHEHVLSCSLESLWNFLTTPRKLVKLSPSELMLNFDNPPEQFSAGDVFRFSISAMGAVIRSQHEITTFEPMTRFVETQREGPFKAWEHDHQFEVISENEVRLTDTMTFKPPGGLVGMMLTEARVTKQLAAGMEYRDETLARLIAAGELC